MKLLDLFCGAGGAAKGYHDAGFEVVGVDHKPQKNYPFEFHRADAFEVLEKYGKDFDVIHASPPCQAFSRLKHMNTPQPDLIEQTRKALVSNGKSYVIENVRGSHLKNAVMLCGTMFNLEIQRHRYFECDPELLFPPVSCNHSGIILNPFNSEGRKGMHKIYGKGKDMEYHWMMAIGLNWMKSRSEWREAIPPAYTEWIGKQIIEAICTIILLRHTGLA